MFHFLKRAVSDSVETNKCASQLCKTAAGCQAPRGGEGPSLGQAHPAQQTPAPSPRGASTPPAPRALGPQLCATRWRGRILLSPLPRRPRWSWPLSRLYLLGTSTCETPLTGRGGSSWLTDSGLAVPSDGAVGEEEARGEAAAVQGGGGAEARRTCAPLLTAQPGLCPSPPGPAIGGRGWGNASSRFGWGRSGAEEPPLDSVPVLPRGGRGSCTCRPGGLHSAGGDTGVTYRTQCPSPRPRTRPGSWPLLARVTVASGLC